jgi:hypothetical protein
VLDECIYFTIIMEHIGTHKVKPALKGLCLKAIVKTILNVTSMNHLNSLVQPCVRSVHTVLMYSLSP